ncbi:MAG TPA: HEAT repeat domain-containing protein, partial [Ktedonobacteraceae bacterium]
ERLPYAAFLPWGETRSLLDTPLRSPDADLRGVALQALIATTRYQRTHLADVLQLVRKHRNEQDPVRNKMLTALSELPHSIWQTTHLDDLAQILHDALNATDLSWSTGQAVERLVVHLFPFHPEWSAVQMAIVYRARGVSFSHLDAYLSNADMQHIAPTLTPILRSWQSRENERLLVILAQSLGKHLRVFDELADLLELTLNDTLSSSIATNILRLFLEHCQERISLLIPRLLRQDKSTIVLEPVYNHLHHRRQDLVTPFLGQHAYKGRFSTGNTRFVLPLNDGFHRWTPAQQETFARTLLEIVDKDKKEQNRATYELTTTIRRIAAMPALDPAPLIQFASDERPPVRETALRALGTLDAGQGIPALIEALNDERARIAIYALRNALLSMPQEEALTFLRTVPFTQVTVAKEVVRLIGDLSSEAAHRELLTMASRDLHRDVRVALLRALWPYTEQEETWEVFMRAAHAPEAAVARGVVHLPEDGMSPVTRRRLAELTAVLLAHPEPEVRMATLEWRSQHPITDTEQLLFARLLSLMNSHTPDECELAASAVFAIYTGNNAVLVGDAIRDLLHNRRALQIAIGNFASALRIGRRRLLPTTRAILATLAEDPLTLSLRIGLIVGGLPWEEIAPELMKLSPSLHANALIRAQDAIQQAQTRPEAQFSTLETALASSKGERMRLLAFAALIAQARQASGWTDECIARLQTYRDDPSPMVAEAAQFTFTW